MASENNCWSEVCPQTKYQWCPAQNSGFSQLFTVGRSLVLHTLFYHITASVGVVVSMNLMSLVFFILWLYEESSDVLAEDCKVLWNSGARSLVEYLVYFSPENKTESFFCYHPVSSEQGAVRPSILSTQEILSLNGTSGKQADGIVSWLFSVNDTEPSLTVLLSGAVVISGFIIGKHLCHLSLLYMQWLRYYT